MTNEKVVVCSSKLDLIVETSGNESRYDYGRRPSAEDWGGGISACCTAGPTVSVSASSEWLHNALWYSGITGQWQSPATVSKTLNS